MQYFCGIDTGGTFTDCVVMDEHGRITIAKSPSTPKDFAEGFFNALEVAAEKLTLTLPQLLQNTRLLLHGTTVGTNAIVQMKGVKTGLITTRGHGDALIIMRSVGRSAGLPIEKLLHVSRHAKPQPIIPRALIQEVSERLDWKGDVFLPLKLFGFERALRQNITKNLQRQSGICRQNARLIERVFHRRRAVDVAANSLDFFSYVLGAACARAFEHHMFQQMRKSLFAGFFVA